MKIDRYNMSYRQFMFTYHSLSLLTPDGNELEDSHGFRHACSLSINHTYLIESSPRIKNKKTKTYNSEDSLVVTHPTTNSPACGLSTAERTGSPVFHTLWSYVACYMCEGIILQRTGSDWVVGV